MSKWAWEDELLENAKETQKTNIKLNLQIIKMAEYIAHTDCDEDICKNLDICLAEDNKDKKYCVECIIKYFNEVK